MHLVDEMPTKKNRNSSSSSSIKWWRRKKRTQNNARFVTHYNGHHFTNENVIYKNHLKNWCVRACWCHHHHHHHHWCSIHIIISDSLAIKCVFVLFSYSFFHHSHSSFDEFIQVFMLTKKDIPENTQRLCWLDSRP